jgi:hypothetical protein
MPVAGTPQLVSLGRWSACPAASVLAAPGICAMYGAPTLSSPTDPATGLKLVLDGSLLWIKMASLVGCRYAGLPHPLFCEALG